LNRVLPAPECPAKDQQEKMRPGEEGDCRDGIGKRFVLEKGVTHRQHRDGSLKQNATKASVVYRVSVECVQGRGGGSIPADQTRRDERFKLNRL
jgi:hypothetical protein